MAGTSVLSLGFFRRGFWFDQAVESDTFFLIFTLVGRCGQQFLHLGHRFRIQRRGHDALVPVGTHDHCGQHGHRVLVMQGRNNILAHLLLGRLDGRHEMLQLVRIGLFNDLLIQRYALLHRQRGWGRFRWWLLRLIHARRVLFMNSQQEQRERKVGDLPLGSFLLFDVQRMLA